MFAVEHDRLNKDVKVFKTSSGLHSTIYLDYDFGSVIYLKKRPTIYFDSSTKRLYIPIVISGGKMTTRYITYKFNGKYFEKVKS